MNKHTRPKFSQMSDAERLTHLGDFQADTGQFLEAKQAMLRVYRGWQTSRDGHLMVISGDSAVGKTTVADDVIQELEEEWKGVVTDGTNEVSEPQSPLPPTVGITKEGPNGLVRPIVKVFVEPKARARGFLRDILHALGVRTGVHDTFGELMDRLQTHVLGQRVRLLILDEVHHVVEGHGSNTAYEAVEVIKMLLLQARVQIVCVGLPITETILDRNPELPRHCRGRLRMIPFGGDLGARSDFIRFLKTLAQELPFDKVPNLTEADLALRIHLATGGYIGHIINLVHAASEVAIELGLEEITANLLGETYCRVSGVAPAENPFALDVVDAATIAAIRKRWGVKDGGNSTGGGGKKPRKSEKNPPDFTKR
ncbi:MAG: TniB family NTP-binding protein [Methylovirgula sp.]